MALLVRWLNRSRPLCRFTTQVSLKYRLCFTTKLMAGMHQKDPEWTEGCWRYKWFEGWKMQRMTSPTSRSKLATAKSKQSICSIRLARINDRLFWSRKRKSQATHWRFLKSPPDRSHLPSSLVSLSPRKTIATCFKVKLCILKKGISYPCSLSLL